MTDTKTGKLIVAIEENYGGNLVCQVCGRAHHSRSATALLRDVKYSAEWVICPDCLAAGPSGASAIAKNRAQELDWLSEQIALIDPAMWASTDDIQKHELVLQGVALGLNQSALRALDVQTLRALLVQATDYDDDDE